MTTHTTPPRDGLDFSRTDADAPVDGVAARVIDVSPGDMTRR